jgi:DNA-binding transcriptional ArsR family regulator
MGISKTGFFTEEQNELANKFKALGHPARIAILQFIVKQGKCICSTIVDELPLAQPTISQHLKELKAVGIIKGSIEGKGICYCVDNNILADLTLRIQELNLDMSISNDTCCN